MKLQAHVLFPCIFWNEDNKLSVGQTRLLHSVVQRFCRFNLPKRFHFMLKHLPCFPLDLQHSLVHEMVKMDNMCYCAYHWFKYRIENEVPARFYFIIYTSRTQLLSSLSCFFFGLPLYVRMLYIRKWCYNSLCNELEFKVLQKDSIDRTCDSLIYIYFFKQISAVPLWISICCFVLILRFTVFLNG